MTGVSLLFVVAGHEGDGFAVLGGDLLGHGLEDRMIVGGRQGVLIAEADAVLPQVPPRLDRANIDPSGVGGVADRPQ